MLTELRDGVLSFHSLGVFVNTRGFLFVGVVFGLFASLSAGQVSAGIRVVSLGTPTDGDRKLEDHSSWLVSFESSFFKIRRVELQISGIVSQAWFDPNGQSNYTERTPGLYPAELPSNSPLWFDSHFVGDPSSVVITSAEEVASRPPFFLPQPNGLMSTPKEHFFNSGPTSVVFGMTPYDNRELITISYDIPVQYQSRQIDLAYLVSNAQAFVGARIFYTDTPINSGASAFLEHIPLPEPTLSTTLTMLGMIALRRNR